LILSSTATTTTVNEQDSEHCPHGQQKICCITTGFPKRANALDTPALSGSYLRIPG